MAEPTAARRFSRQADANASCLIATLGSNLMLDEGVVLKVAYRIDRQHKTPDTKAPCTLGNPLNLGVGISF